MISNRNRVSYEVPPCFHPMYVFWIISAFHNFAAGICLWKVLGEQNSHLHETSHLHVRHLFYFPLYLCFFKKMYTIIGLVSIIHTVLIIGDVNPPTVYFQLTN